MSHHDDNLYTILGKLAALQPTAKEKHDATVKQIYESVEAKGSVLEGVSAVEARLNEKYMGFKDTVSALKKQGGVDNPEGLAASIGRKKYGKKKFQKAAAAGKKLGEQGMTEGEKPHPVELDMIGKTRELGVQNRTKAVMAKNAQQAAEPKNAWQHTKKVIGEPLGKLARGDVKGALSEQDLEEGDVVHKGRYGNDGKDYTGKTGGNPKVQDEPTNAKFDTKGIAGMIGKKTGNKDIGKVSHRQKHEWDNSPEDVAEGNDPFANVDPRVSKPTIPGTKNKAKSAYYPSNKPGQVKKLDKPTSKYDNIKNESRKLQIAEGINFAEMMKETDSTVAEMLNELQKDINSFKQTGHCSDKLEAFLKVHNHGKKLMGEAVPKGPSFAPQDAISLDKSTPFEPSRIQGTKPGVGSRAVSAAVDIAKKGIDALTGPDDAGHLQNLRDKMYKEDAALNELARLAGLKVDESEEVCMECGMYESKCSCEKCMECGMYEAKCSCAEGNLFTKHLKDTPPGGEFEIDGKKYKDTSNLEENVDYSNPEQESRINISTNISTDGNKDVTINATGEQASELLQMLKIAGLGGSDKAQELQSLDLDGEGDELCEPGVELSIMEPEMEVDEDLANNPVEDYYSMKASTMRPGEGDFGEKNMYGGPGDNPMTQRPDRPAQPVMDLAEELAAEYESIKKQL